MSYILDNQNQDASPYALVKVSTSSSLDCDTINDADWLSYDTSTKTITSLSTKNYFECSMSLIRSAGLGIVTYTLDPNDINDQSSWGQLFLVGTSIGGASSYGRGDDTAYSINNTSKINWEYPSNYSSLYTSNHDRCKTLVVRLKT